MRYDANLRVAQHDATLAIAWLHIHVLSHKMRNAMQKMLHVALYIDGHLSIELWTAPV